jgi:hypothetical protein
MGILKGGHHWTAPIRADLTPMDFRLANQSDKLRRSLSTQLTFADGPVSLIHPTISPRLAVIARRVVPLPCGCSVAAPILVFKTLDVDILMVAGQHHAPENV